MGASEGSRIPGPEGHPVAPASGITGASCGSRGSLSKGTGSFPFQERPNTHRPSPRASQSEILSFLKDREPARALAEDLAGSPCAGREADVFTLYLLTLTRLTQTPLGGILEGSAEPRGLLLKTLLDLISPKDVFRCSTLTPQALVYLDRDALRHKLLVVENGKGTEMMAAGLNQLIRDKHITRACVMRDEVTGQFTTRNMEVRGPAAVLGVSEGEVSGAFSESFWIFDTDGTQEQQEALRHSRGKARMLDGLRREMRWERKAALWCEAGRLLRPLPVHNPFAAELQGEERFLTLVEAYVLLDQFRRAPKRDGELGEYLEAEASDLAVVESLCGKVLRKPMAVLPKVSRDLLGLLVLKVGEEKIRPGSGGMRWFTVQDAQHWSGKRDTQLRMHLNRLAEAGSLCKRRHPDGYLLYAVREAEAWFPKSGGGG